MSGAAVAKAGALGADSDVHVAREDQAKINRFARLNAKLGDAQDEVKQKQLLIQNVDDASDELMMLDDDAEDLGVPYLVADAFFYMSSDDASCRLEELKKTLSDEVAGLSAVCSRYNEEMAVLKRELYSKFGDNINLEASDDD